MFCEPYLTSPRRLHDLDAAPVGLELVGHDHGQARCGMPVPISDRCATILTVPFGSIPRYTLGCQSPPSPVLLAACWATALSGSERRGDDQGAGREDVSEEMRGVRLERFRQSCLHPRCLLDGLPDALIRAAAADVALHGGVDLRVGRLGFRLQQGGRLHDLARLAVAALRHVAGLPCPLQGMVAVRAQAFDGRDALPRGAAHRRDATARRFAVNMDRASAAQSHAAAELRAGELRESSRKYHSSGISGSPSNCAAFPLIVNLIIGSPPCCYGMGRRANRRRGRAGVLFGNARSGRSDVPTSASPVGRAVGEMLRFHARAVHQLDE